METMHHLRGFLVPNQQILFFGSITAQENLILDCLFVGNTCLECHVVSGEVLVGTKAPGDGGEGERHLIY